jgi:flagellar basal body-associated protein FliL
MESGLTYQNSSGTCTECDGKAEREQSNEGDSSARLEIILPVVLVVLLIAAIVAASVAVAAYVMHRRRLKAEDRQTL